MSVGYIVPVMHNTFSNSEIGITSCFLLPTIMVAGVSITTDDRRNASATLLREVGFFFPPKKKPLV